MRGNIVGNVLTEYSCHLRWLLNHNCLIIEQLLYLFLMTLDETTFSAPFNAKKMANLMPKLLHGECLKLDAHPNTKSRSNAGPIWVMTAGSGSNSSSRWRRSLSLPALIFLLDHPEQLIFTHKPAVTQAPSGNDSGALLEWTNHIKSVSVGAAAAPRGATCGLSPTVTLVYSQTAAT